MKEINVSRFRLPAMMFVSVALLAGCANLAPVRTFADETKNLTATFEPMLAGSTLSCTEKFTRKKSLTSRNFDPAAVEIAAKELCGPIEQDNKVIADVNLLLEQYADTLLALADDKMVSHKAELDGLAASLGKVKKQGSTEPLVSAEKLGAVAALTNWLGRIATQPRQAKAIRELLDHEAGFLAVTNALRDYANLNYRAWLNDERREITVLKKSLDLSADSEPLAANYLKTILLAEDRQVAKRERAVDSFIASLDQLQRTNSEIRQKFDHLDNKELLAQLAAFSKEVSKLRKQVNSAF